jgi:hypothetical protein
MLPQAAAGDPLPDPVWSELYHGQRVRHHYTSSVLLAEMAQKPKRFYRREIIGDFCTIKTDVRALD